MSFEVPRLYAIIDPAQTGKHLPVTVAGELLSAGVRLIQYRDKNASSVELYQTCSQITERVRQWGGIFVVNDRADVALAVEADGVHLGQDDLPAIAARRVLKPGQSIGASTHTLAQVLEADYSPVDYIAFGPVFPTRSKENPDQVVGLDGLRKAREATRKPLVAIGGITVENARAAIEAGADSVAVISDLLRGADVGVRAREFLKELERA